MNDAKKVVITGGAGFIGSHLAERLLSSGDVEIVIFDSFRHGHNTNLDAISENPAIRLVNGDIRNQKQVENLLDEDVDIVFHLSSIVGIEHYCKDPLEVIDVNVLGTRYVAEMALKRNFRVLYASTSEVFGRNPKIPWSEDDDRVLGSSTVDRWSYSSSKSLCEHMLFALSQHQGLQCSIVRFFNVYGPRQNPIFVVSRGVQRVLNGKSPIIYDSGEQNRCFTFIDDAIEGMILASESEDAIGEAFNIGSNTPTTIREVSEIILELGDPSGKITLESLDTRELYGSKYEDIGLRVPNNSKAANVLGWKPTTSVRDGIASTIEWAKTNDHWLSQ
jgi:UDP-glucose 4-epimerase